MATFQESEARNISTGEHQKSHAPTRSRYGRALKPTSMDPDLIKKAIQKLAEKFEIMDEGGKGWSIKR